MSQYVVSVKSSSLTHQSSYSDLFASCVDSLMSQKTVKRTKGFDTLQKLSWGGRGCDGPV